MYFVISHQFHFFHTPNFTLTKNPNIYFFEIFSKTKQKNKKLAECEIWDDRIRQNLIPFLDHFTRKTNIDYAIIILIGLF